ncbi:MAG: hypothetical protein ACE5O2_00685 [Armatimonadota bacterium]
MNIFAKECLLKWPDKEEVIAELDARISARFKEGETKGTATGYFTLIKGRIPTLHEVRDTRLRLHITDRKGGKYVADVMISLTQPIEYPGTEVPINVESIEAVE